MGDERWFDTLWVGVGTRDRAMYSERLAGRTLRQIGDRFGLTGEWVRQRLLAADRQIVTATDAMLPDWRERLANVTAEPAVSTTMLTRILGINELAAVSILAGAAGFARLRVWGETTVSGWWTAMPVAVDAVLSEIVALAPLRRDELDHMLLAGHLPQDLPLTEMLGYSRSPLIEGVNGSWLRRSARGRDAAYLWMSGSGEPCRIEELAAALGSTKPHAIREALRRDGRFAQIRPEGTWVLAEWSHPGVSPFSNAEEAMVAVLESEGAMTKERLFARVVERYPVTAWRLQQCLSSDRIGLTQAGLIGLIANGAVAIEEPEPTQPKTMALDQSGRVLGIRLNVDSDLLRGSGIIVNAWLTWKLGLHRSPMSKTFAIGGSDDVITIRRGTSGAQISSLRQYAQAIDASLGCQLVLLLRIDDSTARLVHACTKEHCSTGVD